MKRLIARLAVVVVAASFSGLAFAQAPSMPGPGPMPKKGEMMGGEMKDSMKGQMKEEMKTDKMMKPDQADTMGMKKPDDMMEKKKP